jgi:HD domain
MSHGERPALNRTRPGPALVMAMAAILVVGSVAATASVGLVEPRPAVAFALVIALGELARTTLPGDRVQAPLGLAGSLGYAFLARLPSGPTDHSIWQAVAVASTGMLVGTLPHVAVGRPAALDAVARRILVVAFAAATARPLIEGSLTGTRRGELLAVAGLAAVAVLAILLDASFAALVVVDRTGAPFRPTVRNELTAMAGMGAAVGATGLLLALAGEVMGLWSIPVLSVPLLLTQYSFRRYSGIRATYLQTVRSLSRVTELAGYTERGHSRRVSELCLAVGRDLGLDERALRDLEYAALMHDIGQLSLHDPIAGGATVMAAPDERRRIAELGGSVVRQTGVLDRVAQIVEHQADPYRRPHVDLDTDVPVESRVIKVVNDYDDLVSGSLEVARTLDALERLHLGMAYEYDPRVVESLARVLARTAG